MNIFLRILQAMAAALWILALVAYWRFENNSTIFPEIKPPSYPGFFTLISYSVIAYVEARANAWKNVLFLNILALSCCMIMPSQIEWFIASFLGVFSVLIVIYELFFQARH